MTISRRWFLLGAGAMGATAPLTTDGRAEASALRTDRPEALTVTPFATTTYLFDPKYTSALPFAELMAVRISGDVAALNHSVLEVDYDPRVMSPTGADSVAASGTRTTHELAVTASDASTATLEISLLALELAEEAKPSAVTIGIPMTRTATYPSDSVADPRPTRVRLRTDPDKVATELTVVPDPADAVIGAAWGGAIAVVWDDVVLRGSGFSAHYSYPAYVRLESVGPGAIPVGTQIFISVDAGVAGLEIVGIFAGDDPLQDVQTSQSVKSNERSKTTVLTLQHALAAGSALSVAVSAHPVAVATEPRDVDLARVSFAGPVPNSPLQRVTGAESAVAVSDSGRPRVASTFKNKI